MAAPDRIVTRGRWAFRAFVSVAAFTLGAWVIAEPTFDGNMKNWATGIIGVVLGYWLR